MAAELPDMGQIGKEIQTRLTSLESQTQSNTTELSALEQGIIAVCNEVTAGAQSRNTTSNEEK